MSSTAPSLLFRSLLLLIAFAFSVPASADWPTTWREAKEWSKEYVYFDQNRGDYGTLYCGCQWEWAGESGGRVDFDSCGYQPRKQLNRAQRIEYEHIVPAWVIGHQRQCWQRGGRDDCEANDPVFKVASNDLHNLAVSVGETNGDRSNYRFQPLPSTPRPYGACPSKVDFKQRAFEPRDEAKGFVSRVTFYMADRYGLRLSRQQQQVLMAWDRQFPATPWELERNRRIARVTGVSNPFVTGHETWSLGRKVAAAKSQQTREVETNAPIIGNKNSAIYHLPGGICPSYKLVAPHNRVLFHSESEAVKAGFRKAGNCRR